MTEHDDTTHQDKVFHANLKLLRASLKWRVVLAWLAVAVFTLHYLIHPCANMILVWRGMEPLMDLGELSFTDIMALLGGPVVGTITDNLSKERDMKP